MKKKFTSQLLFLVATTLIFSSIVYYGFVSNYTMSVFSKNSFSEQYSSGVYKYRIFSTELLLSVEEWLGEDIDD